MIKQLHPKVIDQPFTDSRRIKALEERHRCGEDRSSDDDCGQDMQATPIPLGNRVVDDLTEKQGRYQSEKGLDDDDEHESGNGPSKRSGIGEHSTDRAATERLAGNRIAITGHHHVERTGHHGLLRLRPAQRVHARTRHRRPMGAGVGGGK